MTLDIGEGAANPATSTVRLTKDGVDMQYGVQTGGANKYTGYSTPSFEIIFTAGQVVNFRTTQGGGTTQRGVVGVWFERLE